jgi:hypothetical protein
MRPKKTDTEKYYKMWEAMARVWKKRSDLDTQRLPKVEAAMVDIRETLQRIEISSNRVNKELFGNGEPDKCLCVRVSRLEALMEKVVGTDQWRKVVLISAVMSILTAVTTGVIMRFVIALPK